MRVRDGSNLTATLLALVWLLLLGIAGNLALFLWELLWF